MSTSFKQFLITEDQLIDEEIISNLNEIILSEGILDPIRKLYVDAFAIAKDIKNSNNRKNGLNDEVFGKLYLEEKEKIEATLENMSVKLKNAFVAYLKKHDIALFSNKVDLSRKNVSRYMVLKITRAVLYAIGQLRDNAYELLIQVVFPGLTTILNAILNAKDAKGVFQELVNSKAQIQQIVKKARQRQYNEG